MNMTFKNAARIGLRTLVVAGVSFALVAGAQAQSRGGHGGGGYHGGYHGGGHGGGHYGHRGGSGWVWGGLGLGLGLGLASYYSAPSYYYGNPGYVVVNPPTVVYDNPQPVYSQPVPARSAQPVIYPRSGQTAATMDADANACSEWAGHQPNATADRSVFERGIAACMDARGYTVR